MFPIRQSNELSTLTAYQKTESPLIDILRMFLLLKERVYPPDMIFSQVLEESDVPTIEKNILNGISESLNSGVPPEEALAPLSKQLIFVPEHFAKVAAVTGSDSSILQGKAQFAVFFAVCWLATSDESIYQYFGAIVALIDSISSFIPVRHLDFVFSSCTIKYINKTKSLSLKMIQMVVPWCSPDNIDAIASLLELSIRNGDVVSKEYLMTTIIDSLGTCPENYSNYESKKLVAVLQLDIDSLSTITLQVIRHLANAQPEGCIQNAYRHFARVLHRVVESEPHEPFTVESRINSDVPEFDYFMKIYNSSFDFDSENTFPEVLSELPEFVIDQPIIDLNLTPKHQAALAELEAVIISSPPECAGAFFDDLSVYSTSGMARDQSLLRDLIHLISMKSSLSLSMNSFKNIVSSPLFDKDITTYYPNPNFREISVLRNSFIQSIATKQSELAPILLETFSDSPFMVADIFPRLVRLTPREKYFELASEACLRPAFYSMSSLWRFYKSKPNIDMKPLQFARKTLIVSIFSILDDQAAASVCFKSTFFVHGFLSRVLESTLQGQVLRIFSKYLQMCDASTLSDANSAIALVEGLLKTCGKTERLETLSIELVSAVADACIENSTLASACAPLVLPVSKLLENRPSLVLLHPLLSLCLSTRSKNDTMPDDVLSVIAHTINSFEGENPSDFFLSSIVGLSAGSRSVSLNVMFIIEDPAPLRLLLAIQRSPRAFRGSIMFLTRLAQHSPTNARQLSRGGIPSILLELATLPIESKIIRGLKYSSMRQLVTEEEFEDVISPLLSILASLSFPLPVTSKLLQSMYPHDGEISPYHKQLVSLFGKSVAACKLIPYPTIPIGMSNPSATFQTFPHNSGKISFTMCSDPSVCNFALSHPIPFRLFDDSRFSMCIYISGDNAVFRSQTTSGVSEVILISDIPAGIWIPYVFSFEFLGESYKVGLERTSCETEYYMIPARNLQIKELNITCGECLGAHADTPPVAIGSICVHYADEIYKPIIHTKCGETLLDSLSTATGIKMLVPLIGYCGMFAPGYGETIMDALTAALSRRPEPKISSVVSSLLSACPQKALTFALFSKVSESPSLSPLLFNIPLWTSAEPSVLTKISSIWSNSDESFGILEGISLIRSYLYIDPVETFINIYPPHESNNHIALARASLFRMMSRGKHTVDDMEEAVAHISDCRDGPLASEILSWLVDQFPIKSLMRSIIGCLPSLKPEPFMKAMYYIKDSGKELDAFSLSIASENISLNALEYALAQRCAAPSVVLSLGIGCDYDKVTEIFTTPILGSKLWPTWPLMLATACEGNSQISALKWAASGINSAESLEFAVSLSEILFNGEIGPMLLLQHITIPTDSSTCTSLLNVLFQTLFLRETRSTFDLPSEEHKKHESIRSVEQLQATIDSYKPGTRYFSSKIDMPILFSLAKTLIESLPSYTDQEHITQYLNMLSNSKREPLSLETQNALSSFYHRLESMRVSTVSTTKKTIKSCIKSLKYPSITLPVGISVEENLQLISHAREDAVIEGKRIRQRFEGLSRPAIDPTLSSSFSHFRLKPSSPSLRSLLTTTQSRNHPLGSYQTILIKLECRTKCRLDIYSDAITLARPQRVTVIPLSTLSLVLLRPNSRLELYCIDYRSYLLEFPEGTSPPLKLIRECRPPRLRVCQIDPPSVFFPRVGRTEEWVTGKLSTFRYLLLCQILAGRSYNDLDIYPSLPHVRDNQIIKEAQKGCPDSVKQWNGRLEPFHSMLGDLKPFAEAINFEMTPELFSLGALHPSSEAYDAYKLRIMLESDTVAKDIPQWFDLTLGYLSEIKLLPHPHPSREIDDTVYITTPVTFFTRCSEVLYMRVLEIREGEIRASIIAGDGSVIVAGLPTNNPFYTSQASVGTLPTGKNIVYLPSGKGISAFDMITGTLYHSGSTYSKGPSVCVASCSSITAALGTDGMIRVWSNKFPDRFETVCEITSGRGHSLAVERDVSALAVLTEEGKVSIHRLRGGALLGEADLQESPISIRITPSLGLVIVETAKSFYSLDQSGKKLTHLPHSHFGNIKSWTVWQDFRGIDFITTFDIRGNLKTYDAFTLEEIATGYISANCISIIYIPELKAYACLSSDGYITVVNRGFK